MRSLLILEAATLASASPTISFTDLKLALDLFSSGSVALCGLTHSPVISKFLYHGYGSQQYCYDQKIAREHAADCVEVPAEAKAYKRSVVADVEQLLATPAPTPAAAEKRAVYENPTSTNMAPPECTPIDWTNENEFVHDSSCPSGDYEVGTYCGFINPEDPCAAQPNAYGPNTHDPDTAEAFKNSPKYHELATKAQEPNGWNVAFSDYDGSMTGEGYLTYKTLTTYDPAECAAFCDQTSACTGFNIFIERDPQFNPDKCSCKTPSIAQIKCSLWGQVVKQDSATNKGQHLSGGFGFDVVIAASNGYNKKYYTPPTPPGCSKPVNCNKKLIDQPLYLINQHTFPGPFDVSLCAAFAHSQNKKNKEYGLLGNLINSVLGFLFGSKGACIQFQAAYLEKDIGGKRVPVGTYCRLTSKRFGANHATVDLDLNVSPINDGTSKYHCQRSYILDVDPQAKVDL